LPQLHFEIGVVNMVLDNFYGIIDDWIEVLSVEEKAAIVLLLPKQV
jgi:hypothetical protein